MGFEFFSLIYFELYQKDLVYDDVELTGTVRNLGELLCECFVLVTDDKESHKPHFNIKEA